MIKHMVKVFTSMLMELGMKENGLKINKYTMDHIVYIAWQRSRDMDRWS